jgi:hypothetical protein
MMMGHRQNTFFWPHPNDSTRVLVMLLQITVQLKFLSLVNKNLWQAAKIFFGSRNGEILLIPTYYSAPSIILL